MTRRSGGAGGRLPAGRRSAVWAASAVALATVAGVGGRAAEPPPGPIAWPDRMGAVSAAEFWRHLEADRLVPTRKYPSFWRQLPASVGVAKPGREGAIEALAAALAIGDLRDGPRVELLDYEGTHVLGEPQIHSVQAFRNADFDAWFLRSKTFSGAWEQWALVQDKRIEPNVAHYFHYRDGKPAQVNERSDCYRCHANGPRALHPGRIDLVSGAEYLQEVNDHCAEQVRVQTEFGGPRPDFGPELAVRECTGCHASDADRGPLHRVQSHSIRAMVSRGFMPPDGELSREGAVELERWLSGR